MIIEINAPENLYKDTKQYFFRKIKNFKKKFQKFFKKLKFWPFWLKFKFQMQFETLNSIIIMASSKNVILGT